MLNANKFSIKNPFKHLEHSFLTDGYFITNVEDKIGGTADGGKLTINSHNSFILKGKGVIRDGITPDNFLTYEVLISDLLLKLGIPAIKKSLVVIKNNTYVASEFTEGLISGEDKFYDIYKENYKVQRVKDHQNNDVYGTLNYYKEEYKNLNNTTHERGLYKMCIALLACGMWDLQIGDNIMAKANGSFIAVDTGLSRFTKTKQYDEWQEYINLLLYDENSEIKKIGEEVLRYKTFVINNIENKTKIIVDFQR